MNASKDTGVLHLFERRRKTRERAGYAKHQVRREIKASLVAKFTCEDDYGGSADARVTRGAVRMCRPSEHRAPRQSSAIAVVTASGTAPPEAIAQLGIPGPAS